MSENKIIPPEFLQQEKSKNENTPKTESEFLEIVNNCTGAQLEERGFKRFFPTGNLYLIPIEYYNAIPDQHEIIDLNGFTKSFKKGVTPEDTRYPCLPYGVYKAN